jgi:hypothetical protein
VNYKDQRRRHMIIVQAGGEPRHAHADAWPHQRTGQVVLPTYTQLSADIPAELRYAAVLAKKMASLNASTTADRKGALSANDDSIDIMNKYGDQVAYNMMRENPMVNSRLGKPINLDEACGRRRHAQSSPDASRSSDPKRQEDLYGHLQTGTKNLIAEKEAAGENVLEAKRLELDAKPSLEHDRARRRRRQPIYPAGQTLEILDVKRQSKPYFAKDLIKDAAESVELKSVHDDPSEALKQIEAEGKKKNELQVKAAFDAFRPYAKEMIDGRDRRGPRGDPRAHRRQREALRRHDAGRNGRAPGSARRKRSALQRHNHQSLPATAKHRTRSRSAHGRSRSRSPARPKWRSRSRGSTPPRSRPGIRTKMTSSTG